MRLLFHTLLLTGLLLPSWCFAQLNAGQSSIDQSYLSFDTDNVLDLETLLELVDDEILSWSANKGYEVENLLDDDLGRHADLTSISVSNGILWCTFDTTIKIRDGSPENNFITVTPQDIVLIHGVFNNAPWQVFKRTFPALENSSSQIDAQSTGHSSGVLMSLDRTTLLEGTTSLTVGPGDVFAWEESLNSDTYTLLFDASSKFMTREMNVTAISWDSTSQLLYLSFDTAGRTDDPGGQRFEANSILVYNPANDTLLAWDTISNDLISSGLSTAANLDAMMLTFIERSETIFVDGFE